MKDEFLTFERRKIFEERGLDLLKADLVQGGGINCTVFASLRATNGSAAIQPINTADSPAGLLRLIDASQWRILIILADARR